MGETEVRSPAAGRIVQVLVAVGATVAEGDEVVLVESMKMEIPVLAPCAGIVAVVHVEAGARVGEHAALVTIA